VRMVEKEQNC